MIYFFGILIAAIIMVVVSFRGRHNRIIAVLATFAMVFIMGLVSYFGVDQVKGSEGLSMSVYIASTIFITSACCWMLLELYGEILELKTRFSNKK